MGFEVGSCTVSSPYFYSIDSVPDPESVVVSSNSFLPQTSSNSGGQIYTYNNTPWVNTGFSINSNNITSTTANETETAVLRKELFNKKAEIEKLNKTLEDLRAIRASAKRQNDNLKKQVQTSNENYMTLMQENIDLHKRLKEKNA